MKRLRVVLVIVVIFVFFVSVFNILAQPGHMCEGDYNRDNNQDAQDVTNFLEDFGRNAYNNPCPEPPLDYAPYMSKIERMFCVDSLECHVNGYEFTPSISDIICCCWDQTGTYNYGCRGIDYCLFDLQGICVW